MNQEYLVSSAFRFLEEQSIETVKRVIEKLKNNHANFFMDDVTCELGPVRKTKLKKDKPLDQRALFLSRVDAT
ncbi:hypothetical protein BN874_30007 [Candidatus Contendobacter odensis Run_B_J11]|uniref:Uncharacterized protein n=1 Tax=Candidatus Contendobacter odensis Run_B_J11 TaxID=1400861 RepID=A0A7U7J4Q0_9GAMM|nr:hypothetical protein BN874_30007 [Candidatus Contendobacter odensis Run_B_J11]